MTNRHSFAAIHLIPILHTNNLNIYDFKHNYQHENRKWLIWLDQSVDSDVSMPTRYKMARF
jgi:hypothetical protein